MTILCQSRQAQYPRKIHYDALSNTSAESCRREQDETISEVHITAPLLNKQKQNKQPGVVG